MIAPRPGAVIGAGGVARLAHIPAYRGEDGIGARLQLVGAVDAHLPALEVDGLPVHRSLAALRERAPIAFVDICTPTASHHQLILESLDAGLHVFCEKPVAITLREAGELSRAVAAADRALMPCHQYRENPAWRALKRWLDDGAIGRWHLAEFNVYRPEADRGAAASAAPWRGQRADAMGGVLLDHGTHLVYLLLDAGGMPRAVQAHLSRLLHGYDVEDTAHVLFDFGDRVATLKLTWAGGQRENRVKFIGESGTIDWIGGTLVRTERSGATETLDFSAELDKRAYAGWVGRVLHRFADVIDGEDRAAPLREIEQVALLLESAYRADAEGCRIQLA